MPQVKAERKPYVAIFGDDHSQRLTKTVWTLLSGRDLKLANVKDTNELDEISSDAVIILVKLCGAADKNLNLARHISQNPRVVANIIAVTEDSGPEERMKILAAGYDAIFNFAFMDYPDFRQVLLNRVEKGYTNLENRIQQEEYRRFKAALAASPDAFIVFDQNNKLFFVSEHYRNAYPQSGPKLVRGLDVMDAFKMCTEEEGVSPDSPRYQLMKQFWSTLEGQAEYRTDDGRFWYVKAKKLPDGQGSIVTTADITTYKKQQLELEEQSERLADTLDKEKEASSIQKQFINMVSHEFRTPLTIIDGNAQILQRRAATVTPEDVNRKTRTIRSAVSRLVNMMEGVLSSNMLKTGKLELMPEPVNLQKLISELCAEHSDLYTDHRITWDVDALSEPVTLDRKLITLVIGNLLSNAVKFTRESPHIEVKGWQENDAVKITFTDNGIGIPANEIGAIFDRYYRSTVASGTPGTGIGLNLVKELVQLHHGTINVESTIGQGTRFEVSLPLKHSPEHNGAPDHEDTGNRP